MFPLTEEERMAAIRATLSKKEEAAKVKRDSAFAALDEATEKWTEAAALLETFDAMHGVVAAARAAYSTPEGVDPVTGEVAAAPEPQAADPAGEPSAEQVAEDRLTAAIRLVVATGAASVAMLQRRLEIGYAEAAALLDAMEKAGVVAPAAEGSKARSVLIDQAQLDDALLEAAIERARGDAGARILHAVADDVNAGALDGDGVTVTAVVRSGA
jgi:DNA segregation ATPase FtsK/SpoIIIE-like protein